MTCASFNPDASVAGICQHQIKTDPIQARPEAKPGRNIGFAGCASGAVVVTTARAAA